MVGHEVQALDNFLIPGDRVEVDDERRGPEAKSNSDDLVEA
jgi:hypothetical protein